MNQESKAKATTKIFLIDIKLLKEQHIKCESGSDCEAAS